MANQNGDTISVSEIQSAQINILGQKWTIFSTNNYYEWTNPEGTGTLQGCIDYNQKKIAIFNLGVRSYEEIWEVIIHEILHAIAFTLKIEHFNLIENHWQFRKLAKAISSVLYENSFIEKRFYGNNLWAKFKKFLDFNQIKKITADETIVKFRERYRVDETMIEEF